MWGICLRLPALGFAAVCRLTSAPTVVSALGRPIYFASNMKVIVIIPAAGLGARMGAAGATAQGKAPSKQFLELAGRPILVHTLTKFAESAEVDEICLVMRHAEAEAFEPELKKLGFKKPIRIAEGGEHRQHSVANALAAIEAADDDIVLIHDAVRPFVDQETISAVIVAVKRTGAAIAGVPATDTIKQVERTADGANIRTTIPREYIVQAQTPQGFRFGILKRVFEAAIAEGFLGTDESSLLERAGYPVEVVMGSTRNIKITTPADLELAEFFISQSNRRRQSLTE